MPAEDAEKGALVRVRLWCAGARARAQYYWKRASDLGLASRCARHGLFLLSVTAGLFLSHVGLRHASQSILLALPLPTPCPVNDGATARAGTGTGGEMPDLLLCAVVPHTTIPRRYRIDPITYTVQTGDNVSSIAEQFGVSVETVLWANGDLEDNPDYLKLDDVLTILPVSGVHHTVAKDDTLDSIAAQYKARVEDIVAYEGNHLQEPYTLTVGQKLIVPGGSKPYQVRHVVAWSGAIPAGAKRGSGQFGWPMSGYITQRYHEYHQAADIAAPEGTAVKAADSGYVALVGRNDTGYGRYLLIDHGNGFQTVYAHFGMIYVEVGQSVAKGSVIGLCGSTGKSTGPHLHFEIKLNGVRRNPFIYLP